MSTPRPMAAAAVDRNKDDAPGAPPFPDMVWVGRAAQKVGQTPLGK